MITSTTTRTDYNTEELRFNGGDILIDKRTGKKGILKEAYVGPLPHSDGYKWYLVVELGDGHVSRGQQAHYIKNPPALPEELFTL